MLRSHVPMNLPDSRSRVPSLRTQSPAAAQSYSLFWETVAVLLVAGAFFAWQGFWCGKPNLTLIFDSFGYLSTASNVVATCTPNIVASVYDLFTSGFSASAQSTLAQQLEPIRELTKTGPVLPLLLAFFYSVAHKAAMPANWQIGATTMVACQSITAVLIFHLARLLGGRTVARVALILTLLYAPFSLNATRILSEIPALLIVTLSLVAMFVSTRRLEQKYATAVVGIVYGISLAALTLARPNLALLPFCLLTITIWQKRKYLQIKRLFVLGLTLTVSSALALLPWVAFKWVMTGHPSVSIDRNTAMNIWVGSDVAHNGWDVQPYASHPEEFKLNVTEVLERIRTEIVTQPFAYMSLMAQKPARLLDSPWNDFQTSFLCFPWWMQRWYHQLLLMLALFGACRALSKTNSEPPSEQQNEVRFRALLLVSTIGYHFINCLFIAMGRYFYTCETAVVALAAYGIVALLRENRYLTAALLAGIPVVLACTNYCPAEPGGYLAQFARALGIAPFSFLVASAIALLFSITVLQIVRPTISGALSRCALYLLAVLTAVCTFTAVKNQLLTLEFPLAYPVSATIFQPEKVSPARVFLVVDVFQNHRDSQRQPAIGATVNNVAITDRFLPLWAFDKLNHEGLLYQTQVAYASGKSLLDFRQWFCAELPPGLVHSGRNTVQIGDAAEQSGFVLADFSETGHALSLDQYSWTKGFMVGSPGDYRIDTWSTVKRQPRELHPRIFLLELPSDASTGNRLTVADASKQPSAALNTTETLLSPQVTIAARNPLVDLHPSTPPANPTEQNLLHIQVSGTYRAIDKPCTVSTVLLSTVTQEDQYKRKSGQEYFASMAPLRLKATQTWQSFDYDETVPSVDRQNARLRLSSLRLLLAGRCWWDVLAYGQYKPTGRLEFKNIAIKTKERDQIDLQNPAWKLYPSQLVALPDR